MLHLKPFRQSPGFCGPASLKMVLAHFGLKKSERELAKLSKTTRAKGATAKGLVRAAKILGFEALVKDFCKLSDLKTYVLKKRLPVIVDWFSCEEGHYSVVAGIKRGKIYLQDPETSGLRSFPWKTFQRIWFDFSGDYLRSSKEIILRRIIVIWPKNLREDNGLRDFVIR